MKMKEDQLIKLYNAVTGRKEIGFYSIFDRNFAHLEIYHRSPITWEAIFLREVYEELQKELPRIKKKVIAKAIRELKEEYKLSLMIERRMKIYGWSMREGKDPILKIAHIDERLKNEFKNYIKRMFRQNKVEWHWWNILEWGL